MRVLPDECLPKRLKRSLVGHDVKTVPEAGWVGKKNGAVVLRARSNRLADLEPLVPRILKELLVVRR